MGSTLLEAAAKLKPVRLKGIEPCSLKLFIELQSYVLYRYIRTLRTALRRWWHSNNTFKWTDIVQRLTNTYNHTVSRTHGEKPAAIIASPAAALRAYERLIGFSCPKEAKQRNYDRRVQVGSLVRISRLRGQFEKESTYLGLWSREIYKVVRVA